MGVGGFARLWSDVDLFSASLAGIRGDIASLGMALTQLRTEAATGRITPLAILDSYSKLLQRLADEMDRLPVSPKQPLPRPTWLRIRT